MSRKTKITKSQLIANLQKKQAYGESRHQGKRDGTAEGKIYSFNTYNTYRKQISHFYDYVYKMTHGAIKDMSVFSDFVQSYIDQYDSAWSQKTALSAMRKADIRVPEVVTKQETRASIKKNRGAPELGSIHDHVIELCRISGLRRHEIAQIRSENLIEDRGKWYLINVKGKGGKIRKIRLLSEPSGPLKKALSAGLPAPPRAVNVHMIRRDYARQVYQRYLEALKASGRKLTYMYLRKDQAGVKICKEAALYTSRQLGHNRIDVVVRNYLL